MIAAAFASYLSKRVISIVVKVAASIGGVIVVLTLGMVVPYDIIWIIICQFFLSLFIGIYFTSNN